MATRNLRIAVQRSGRLGEPSIELLHKCDISVENGLGKLKSTARNFPMDVLFVRDDDIPRYIDDGVADIGIVGQNVLEEAGSNPKRLLDLGFGRCRLAVAVPRGSENGGVASLNGKRIATTYPNILSRFLAANSIDAEIHTISGSVEIAPSIGLAEAVCDLVSSGNTLFTNGLTEVETIFISEAVLISGDDIAEVADTLDTFLFRLRSVIAARRNKYILLNSPNAKIGEIMRLLPGIKSPTVMPLAIDGWSSLHSVIGEEDYWNVVADLKAAGAEGILILNIENMVG